MHNLYTLQAPRERPTGYSTLAPRPTYGFYHRYGRLACGAWLPRDRGELERLGVRSMVFHRGLYRRGLPGAWFAWQEPHGARLAPGRGRRGGDSPRAACRPEHAERARRAGAKRALLLPRLEQRAADARAACAVLGLGQRPARWVPSVRPTEAILWVDEVRERLFTINGRGAVRVRLAGERWHPVLVEIPTLLESGEPARPPAGSDQLSLGLAVTGAGVPLSQWRSSKPSEARR